MNKIFLTIFAAIVFFMLNGCHSSKPISSGTTGGSEMLYQYQWNLIELQGQPVMTGSGETPHLLFSPGQLNKVTGSTGCNRLNGSFELTDINIIKFSPLATTKMACRGMNKEAPFIEAMGKANNWSIINDQLMLSDGKIVLAKFRRTTTTTTMPDIPGAGAALDGTWNLNYISGLRIAFDGLYPDKKPFVSFNLPAKELSGNTTCNGFTSKFTMNGNNIKFADPLKTMIFCEGGGEEAFLNMLKKVNNYALTDDHTLTFLIDDVAVMRFVKK